jgi:hypothetical protein
MTRRNKSQKRGKRKDVIGKIIKNKVTNYSLMNMEERVENEQMI